MKNGIQFRMRASVLTAALFALSLTVFAACKPSKGGPPPGMKIPVVVAPVKSELLRSTVRAVGDVAGDESVELRSEVDGRIKDIAFREGQVVEKGASLMQVDPEKLSANYAEARAQLSLARANRDRNKELLETKTISQKEYDQAEAEFLSARATATRLKETLTDAHLRAPFSGVMGQRLVSPGQYVQKGQAVSSIVALEHVKVDFSVPERYVAKVKEGQKVLLNVAAYEDEQFEGEVFFVSSQIDTATRTVLVKARVPNAERKLRAGMLASIQIVLNEKPNALVVPETAVMLQKQTARVFVATEEGSVAVREVVLGEQLDGKVEIQSGLKEGELVIAEGTQKVGPGVPVSFEKPS